MNAGTVIWPTISNRPGLRLPAYTDYRPRNAYRNVVVGTTFQASILGAGTITAVTGDVYRSAPWGVKSFPHEQDGCIQLDHRLVVNGIRKFNIGFGSDGFPDGSEIEQDITAIPLPTAANMGENFNTSEFFTLLGEYEFGIAGQNLDGPCVFNCDVTITPVWRIGGVIVDGAELDVGISVVYGLDGKTGPPSNKTVGATPRISLWITDDNGDPIIGNPGVLTVAPKVGVITDDLLGRRSLWGASGMDFSLLRPAGSSMVTGYYISFEDLFAELNKGAPGSELDVDYRVFGAIGPRTYYVWTATLDRAPAGMVGYLYHREGETLAYPNPPIGVIYPLYTTEQEM